MPERRSAMTKVISALLLVLSLSLFGAGAVSAFESSPTAVTQDGDQGKKKHGKKKGKKHGKKHGKKNQGKKKHGKKKQS
jgi:hypothetical protein